MTHRPPPHPVRRRSGFVATVVAALLMLGSLAAPAAEAHTDLSSSDPADGGTVAQPPAVVRLVFADRVTAETPVLTVTVDGGAPVEVPAVIDGATVSADLAAAGLPGPTAAGAPAQWQIGYRLVALDGDTFTGDISFTVLAAAPTTVAATSAPASSSVPETSSELPEPPSAAAPGTSVTTTTVTTTTVSTTTTSEVSAAAPGTSADSVAPSATGTPAAAADAPSSGGGAGWWWFAGIALVVLVAGGIFWSVRSRRPGPTG